MSVGIGLDDAAFGRAREEVMAAHDELGRGAGSLAQGARDLFEGWRGLAAGQYEQAWEDWEAGVSRALSSLLELSAAMEAARDGLRGADAVAAARASYLRTRLEGR